MEISKNTNPDIIVGTDSRRGSNKSGQSEWDSPDHSKADDGNNHHSNNSVQNNSMDVPFVDGGCSTVKPKEDASETDKDNKDVPKSDSISFGSENSFTGKKENQQEGKDHNTGEDNHSGQEHKNGVKPEGGVTCTGLQVDEADAGSINDTWDSDPPSVSHQANPQVGGQRQGNTSTNDVEKTVEETDKDDDNKDDSLHPKSENEATCNLPVPDQGQGRKSIDDSWDSDHSSMVDDTFEIPGMQSGQFTSRSQLNTTQLEDDFEDKEIDAESTTARSSPTVFDNKDQMDGNETSPSTAVVEVRRPTYTYVRRSDFVQDLLIKGAHYSFICIIKYS